MPLDITKFLLFHQPNLAHKVYMEGRLQLQLACQNVNLKLIELLTRLHARSLEQQDKFVCLRLHYAFERKHESLEILDFLLQNFPKGIYVPMSMDAFHCTRRAVGIQLLSSASNDWYKPMSIPYYYNRHLMEILLYTWHLATISTAIGSRATSFCT
mmetsp:Transcript_16076/g.29058  ORF Transcript_16076/g.29058 Transcript_16076/m.29058 type:complete len:156 (-) Transcript_16076:267-734(-)